MYFIIIVIIWYWITQVVLEYLPLHERADEHSHGKYTQIRGYHAIKTTDGGSDRKSAIRKTLILPLKLQPFPRYYRNIDLQCRGTVANLAPLSRYWHASASYEKP